MLLFELEVFDGDKTETYHVVRSVEDKSIEEDILEQSPYGFIDPSIGYSYKVSVTKLKPGEYMHRPFVEPYQWIFDSIINYGRLIPPKVQALERLNKKGDSYTDTEHSDFYKCKNKDCDFFFEVPGNYILDDATYAYCPICESANLLSRAKPVEFPKGMIPKLTGTIKTSELNEFMGKIGYTYAEMLKDFLNRNPSMSSKFDDYRPAPGKNSIYVWLTNGEKHLVTWLESFDTYVAERLSK